MYTPQISILAYGLWWQFRMRMMSEKEAKAFITQVAPLGTMDYSLLNRRPPIMKTSYGFSWPVPPTTLIIGGGSISIAGSWDCARLLCVSDGKDL